MGDVVKKTIHKDEKKEKSENKSPSNKIGSRISYLVEKLPMLGELFDFHGKIGEGTFSCVYLMSEKGCTEEGSKKRWFAAKHLIPTCHPSRVYRELCCMHEMGGVDNVVGVNMCLRKDDCIVFVMPYQEHDRFTSYVLDMSVSEAQLYLKQLLIAVRRVHSFGIIHRDIKPSNFLYNRKQKKFLLVDFGLAQKVEECNMTEDGENVQGIGKNMQGTCKKRKREDNEVDKYEGGGSEVAGAKRQALQQLSSNFTSLSDSVGKRSSEPVKRVPLQSVNTGGAPVSFVRVQNSQVVGARGERVFAKPQVPLKKCHCDGRPRICNRCVTRKAQGAPRAGTPGFRPPEVLLKSLRQTTAVDMWAVGVMLLCVLSGTYPFFRSPDDVTALAEMITVFGTEKIKNIANKLGRNVVCSEDRAPLDLRLACEKLRQRKKEATHRKNPEEVFPAEAYDLLYRLLELDPSMRITAEQALSHPFILHAS